MRSVDFHPEAEAEFISAAGYFEDRAEGLGLAFISAVERTYQRILEYPEIGRPFGRRLRRVLVPGFHTAFSIESSRSGSSSLPWHTFAAGRAIGGLVAETGNGCSPRS